MNVRQYAQANFTPFPVWRNPQVEPDQVWLERNRDAVAIVIDTNHNGVEYMHIDSTGKRYKTMMHTPMFLSRHQLCK
jgi:hypothetical protein